MSPEITSYNTYGEYNERNGRYVGMSVAGWQVYYALTDPNKILLRDGLKMLMKQVFEDKKLDLPAINAMRSRSAQNDQCMCIESIKKQDGDGHDFIGKLTIGHDTYFIKLIHQTINYTPYHEYKAQDISKQLLGGDMPVAVYDGAGPRTYVRIANPLYSFTKRFADGSYSGFIIYPFEDNIKLLGDDSKLTDIYYEMIIDVLGLEGSRIKDLHDLNISYKYNDNGSLIFTVFDLGLWDAIDKIHNLYPHAPRPPKPPRHTNT